MSHFVKVHWALRDEEWFWDDRALAAYLRELIRADKVRRGRRRYVPSQVWAAVLRRFGSRCVYCGRNDVPLEREHRLAVIHGGLDDETNIVPACRDCNARKGTDDPSDWPILFGAES